ncbi:DUF4446 family protein [[Clostridium] colinum]|uniref:DUF4446 family protein n=1 Tax=[Clostridium] colinum TaxID=36835 RepID=UPI00202461B3|nr:DUF4446 family protein [[Clostridium] colinum]
MDRFISNLDIEFFTPTVMFFSLAVYAILLLILLLFIIILTIKLSKMKKRLKKFLPEDKNIDIENMLIQYNENVKNTLSNQQKILEQIENNKQSLANDIEATNKLIYLTNEKLKNAVQKVSIVRYNPFQEVGGDLCYAIALLDEYNNGIVINSIYSREACYSYAKEIINGKSPKHKLAQEEIEALEKAMNK